MRFPRPLVATTVLMILFAAKMSFAQGVTVSKTEFSADGKRLTIEFNGRTATIHRPVVPSSDFPVLGNVYWVATNGSNSHPGTQESPFKTINKGVSVSGPGDIVYIKAGTYVENLQITQSGQDGLPIVISAAPGAIGKVRITPSSSYVGANPGGAVIELNGARHVWINGLVIEGPRGRPEAPSNEMYGANGITWSGGAGDGTRVTNNVVYDNVHCGIKEMGHGGKNILIAGNVIFANGFDTRDHGIYAPSDDTRIIGNILFFNTGWGIHSYKEPTGQLISRNISVANGFGGILLAGNNTEVYHNIAAFQGWGIVYFREGSAFNVVKNNIFAFNSGGDAGFDDAGGQQPGPHHNVDDYNCYTKQPPSKLQPGPNEIITNPFFVNPGSGDFRLSAVSPCIDGGTDVGYSFFGPAPDMGPFEYSTTAGIPEMVSPTPGSTLPQPSVVFQWDSNGVNVTEWRLRVGSAVGKNDYFGSGPLTGNTSSAVVQNLPTDGSPIFVGLWALIDGYWQIANYQYVALLEP